MEKDEEKVSKTKVIYNDILGIGEAVKSTANACAGIVIVLIIGLSCSGQWPAFFNLFKG